MAYKRLFVFVEGNDDVRFFESAVKSSFDNQYDYVRIIAYAQTKTEKIKNFVTSIKAMGADYIIVADINDAPCVTERKEKTKRRFGTDIIDEKIVLTIREIESWYLAGLTDYRCEKLRLRNIPNTDNMTKEKFNSLIPKNFSSRIDFMVEILTYFSMPTARKKNKSFSYFHKKYL